MNIQITSRHTKVSSGVQDFLRGELENLAKYYDKITSCHAIVDSEHGEDLVEIQCSISGKNIVGKASADNLGKAIDSAFDKVTTQLKKSNDKMKEHKAKRFEEEKPDEEEEVY